MRNLSENETKAVDDFCLYTLGYDAVRNIHKAPVRHILSLLSKAMRVALADCNYDWDALTESKQFRTAVAMLASYEVKMETDEVQMDKRMDLFEL